MSVNKSYYWEISPQEALIMCFWVFNQGANKDEVRLDVIKKRGKKSNLPNTFDDDCSL